jgi:DNA-binding response OmpR family regulator
MGKRILLCDDEPHILRAAEFKFKRAGYEVACASDGEEGWELVNSFQPQILVTDYQMPRLDGLGLVIRVRENPETAQLPVFMLTAKGFELSHAETCEKYGIRAVLAKPFSPRELFQRVEEILDNQTAESTPEIVGSL